MCRSLLFFLLLLSSPIFGMKKCIKSDENKEIVKQLCTDLGFSQRNTLNETYRLRSAHNDDWSDVRAKDVGDKVFTYYIITLNDVDFEFVGVPIGEGSEIDFMMSHWVTQRQWEAVMRENPAHFADRGLNLPMENVSYDEIVNNFLPHLNNLLQEAGFEGKFKLPSDDQWQRMADQNVATDFASNRLKYSDFGKGWDSGQPLPVKSKERGNLGAWMFGSVWEWVGIPTATGHVVLRGGSWCYYSGMVSPSKRDASSSDIRRRSIGLRLFRTYPRQA